MKKTFLAISALAAVLFAGCTSSDELTTLESVKNADNTPTPVQFGTYMGKSGTRSGLTGAITDTQLKGTWDDDGDGGTTPEVPVGFGVFAYHTNTNTWATAGAETIPNFMYNQKVSWGTSVWEYTPLKFWPNDFSATQVDANQPESEDVNATGSQAGGKISFYAYAPYVELPTSPTTLTSTGITAINGLGYAGGASGTPGTGNQKKGAPIISYTLNNDIQESANVDLLWGLRGLASYNLAYGGTSAGTVGVDYNVDITKLKQGSGDVDKVNFEFHHALTKICEFKVVADIDGNSASPATAGLSPLPTTTQILLTNVTIEDNAGNVFKSGDFNLSTGAWTNVTTAADFNYSYTNASAINTNVWEKADPAPSYSSGWSPIGVKADELQNIFSTNPSFFLIPDQEQKLDITVSYTVRTYDPNLAAVGGVTCSKVDQTIKNTVTLPATVLNPHEKITLVLHIGLTSVKFAATVDGWDNGGTEVVWLPSNVIEE